MELTDTVNLTENKIDERQMNGMKKQLKATIDKMVITSVDYSSMDATNDDALDITIKGFMISNP